MLQPNRVEVLNMIKQGKVSKVLSRANSLRKSRCENCNEELRQGREVWLELNSRTSKWRAETDKEFPEEESQGWFPFGAACATKVLKKKKETSRLTKKDYKTILEALQYMEEAYGHTESQSFLREECERIAQKIYKILNTKANARAEEIRGEG